VEIYHRKSEKLGKKVFGQGEGEEEDGVGYGEDVFLNVGERQKPRDGATSMTSFKKCYQAR